MRHITIVFVSTLLLFVAKSYGSSVSDTYRTLFEYPADALGINDLEGQENAPIPTAQKSSGHISQSHSDGGGDDLDKLRRSIQGEPDVDYPIFRTPPETEFSCHSRSTGYYADVEARCQVFRVCTNTDLTEKGFAFLCPNGTLFNQEVFVCDWYQHVDCSSSENHYGKNAEMNMKFNSVSDMMAVVHEMMNFPLKPNSQPPTLLPNSQPNFQTTPQVTRRPSVVPTTVPFSLQTTQRPASVSNQFTSPPFRPTPSIPSTTRQFGTGLPNSNTQPPKFVTPGRPQQPTQGLGTKTITQEGDIDINSKNGFDNTKTVQQTTFTNQPIFISSLGELSTDKGKKFDINRVRLIKPDEGATAFTQAPPNKGDELKNSLSKSFRGRPNGISAGENKLADGLQRVLNQNPDLRVQVLSGEADLLQFIELILQRNPHLDANQLNAILTAESDAILDILNNAVQNSEAGTKARENDILDKIQNILNKYKNNPNALNSPASQQIAVFSGDADLLDSLRQLIQRQSGIQIFSGEADLIQFIERLVQQNPDFTKQQLASIIKGEADSILKILNEKRQVNNGQFVESGEADLLQAIQIVLQKYRGQKVPGSVASIPVQSLSAQRAIESGEADLLTNILRQISQRSRVPIFSGEADLLQFIERLVQQNPDFRREQLASILSGEADSILRILNEKRQRGQLVESGEADLLEAIQIVLQKYRGGQSVATAQPQLNPVQTKTNVKPVESGEDDLLQSIIQRIQQQSRVPIFSGEADLVQFIERLVQQNADFTREQLYGIINREFDTILRLFHQKRRQNNGQLVESGEADLLEAIQIVLQKYRGGQSIPTAPPALKQVQSQFGAQAIQSGEVDLLANTLRQISQRNQIPIFSGEADLVQFIERLVQQNPDFTRQQLSSILSGEADLISRILNEKRQVNNGQFVESGEADLLQAIQIVLQKYRGGQNIPTAPPALKQVQSQFGTQAIQSGEADLLTNILRQILQKNQIAIFSGEADLVQFIERLVQQNPDFTKEQLSSILSGEADLISSILTEKRRRNNGQFVESGEADLLEAIQIVLQKYRGGSTLAPNQPQSVPTQQSIGSGEADLLGAILKRIQQQIQIPIFSGEADLVQFIERLIEQNPDLSREKLAAILSGEAESILRILNERKQNGQLIESGEADLLEAIQIVLQKYLQNAGNSNQLKPPFQTGSLIQNEQDAKITDKNRFSQASHGVNHQNGATDLLNHGFFNQQPNNNGIKVNSNKPVSATIAPNERGRGLSTTAFSSFTQAPITPVSRVVDTHLPKSDNGLTFNKGSGESDLLKQTLQQILLRVPNQKQQILSGENNLVELAQSVRNLYPDFTAEQLASINGGEASSILRLLNEKSHQNNGIATGNADLLDSIQSVLQKYRLNNQLVPPLREPVFAGEDNLIKTIHQIEEKSTVQIAFKESDLLQFVRRIEHQNPTYTPTQLNNIIESGVDYIVETLSQSARNSHQDFEAFSSGEEDLLVSIQHYVETWVKPDGTPVSPPNPPNRQTYAQQTVQSGDADLLTNILRQTLQRNQIAIFSGEADLVQFIERLVQQNPDFTRQQLSSILSGEADSVLSILNEKRRVNNGQFVESGEADLLQAIQIVLQKYRGGSTQTVVRPQSAAPYQAKTVQPISGQFQSGNANLLRTIQNIQHEMQIPVFSGEADLVQFIELIRQETPELTPNQLNTIIEKEADSIKQILGQQGRNSARNQPVQSGDAELLSAIFQVLKKYRRNYQSTASFAPPTAASSRALNSFGNTQTSQDPIRLNQLPQEIKGTGQVSTHSVRGQLTAITSGQSDSFYRYSNGNPVNAGANGNAAVYSVQQNEQSQFSNQQSQSTQSQITKNVFRGQDNIYTQTAVSHQTRSQSTLSNSQKIHYKITQTIPEQNPQPQFIQTPVSSTKVPNTYIPPYPTTRSPPYTFTPTQASKQVFTYPAETEVTEVRKQSDSINIARAPIKYQSISKQIDAQKPPSSPAPSPIPTPAPVRPIPQAYVYTEIENRPPVNFNIPVPPLNTDYPKSIQNNVESRVVNRPSAISHRQYSAPSIPLTLPSIVHEPSNTVATIQNVPSTFIGSSSSISNSNALSDAQRIASLRYPVITSTYSNRETYSNSNAREKVVVKVVKAPGWYLNDANERISYFNAVAHGLLSENGLVYVNNVQKENVAQLAQNAPINLSPSSVVPPAFAQSQASPSQSASIAYSPKNILPPALLQSQSVTASGNVPQFNVNNVHTWPACAQAVYTQLTQALPQVHSQSPHFRIQKRSADDADVPTDPYNGRSSYNVDSQSVGQLAGDGRLYNLASLRQPTNKRPLIE